MQHSAAPQVAVCIAGLLRNFLEAPVQEGFATMLHQPGYDYFVSAEQRVAMNDSRLRVPLRGSIGQHLGWDSASYRIRKAHLRHLVPRCGPNTTSRHHDQLPQAKRLEPCYEMILSEEQARHFSYAFVMRVRPDHHFERRVPHASQLLARWAVDRDLLLMDDQIAVAVRQYLSTLFLTPLTVFTSCINATAWSHACGKRLDEVSNAASLRCPPCFPCGIMSLISYFGNARTWAKLPHAPCTVHIERTGQIAGYVKSKADVEHKHREASHCENDTVSVWARPLLTSPAA